MWYQFILQVHDVDDKKLIEGIHKFLLAHIGICYNIGIVVYNYTTCPWLHYKVGHLHSELHRNCGVEFAWSNFT